MRSQVALTPSPSWKSTAGLGVKEHAAHLRHGQASETGRDYGHHLNNHERDVYVVRCLSTHAHTGVDASCNGRSLSGLRSFSPLLGRFPNTLLMIAISYDF